MSIRKITTSIILVALLAVPTIFGAVPLTIYTSAGTISLDVQVAEARARNTSNNRLRNLRVPTSGVDFTQRFAATRHTYTVNVRENVNRVQLQPTRGNNNQSVRHRIDTRLATGEWRNGNWSRWRTGAGANNRISANINQGQERRVRIAVRDRAGNVRTYTVNMRRASNNTFASSLRVNNGATLQRAFNRSAERHIVNLPANRSQTQIAMNRAQLNAQSRVQVGSGNWSAWSRADVRRNVSVNPGQSQTVRVQIRGAWTNLVGSPTRTRTYVITVNRAAQQAQAPSTPAQTPPANNNQQRTLFFASEGGSAVAARNFTSGQALGALPTPTRAGFNFVGWFTQSVGGEQVTAQTVRTDNLTVFARWHAPLIIDAQGWRHVQGQEWLRFNPQRSEFQMTATADWTEAQEAFRAINQYRVANGRPALEFCIELSNAAMQRAVEADILWSHTRPDGSHWSTAVEGSATGAAENMARGSASGNAVFEGWRASPGHRANILNEWSTHAGVGFVRTPNGTFAAFLPGWGFLDNCTGWPTGRQQNTFAIPWSAAAPQQINAPHLNRLTSGQ